MMAAVAITAKRNFILSSPVAEIVPRQLPSGANVPPDQIALSLSRNRASDSERFHLRVYSELRGPVD
jgi:hypothetical protein